MYVDTSVDSLERLHARWMKLLYRLPSVNLSELVPNQPIRVQPILDDVSLPVPSNDCDHDDLLPFASIVQLARPRIVVEFGTGFGNLTANVCHLCPDASVYTVNATPEQQTGMLTTFRIAKDEIGRVYRKRGFEGRVTQIYANTLDVDMGAHLERETVDLGIIDACHDTGYVLNDFHKLAPFVRGGGTVLLHDTHPSLKGHLVSSYRACMLLRKQGFDVRHIQGTWWGIWQRESDSSPLSEAPQSPP